MTNNAFHYSSRLPGASNGSRSRYPLSWLDPKRFKILYLAKHAPLQHQTKPDLNPTTGITPAYHYEIHEILTALGFRIEACRSLSRLIEGPRDYDYVFSLYNKAHFNDAEVFVSAVCEYLGTPYLGARPHMRSLAEDKHLTKLLARHLDIPVPLWKIYRRDNFYPDAPPFPGPYFAKPRCGAGSKGIDHNSLQDQWPDLLPHIQRILESGDDVIVERFVEGDNVTVALLGSEMPLLLPPIKAISPETGGIMTRRQKKMLDRTLVRVEYEEPVRRQQVETMALRLFEEFRPVDYMRVDFRIPPLPEERPYLLETNICCNLGSHASMVLAAERAGISQVEMIARILDYSLRRQKVGR